MIIQVKVNTSSSKESVDIVDDVYKVKFKATREKGKANKKLLKLLSKYFQVSISQIEIIKGEFSKNKLVRISN